MCNYYVLLELLSLLKFLYSIGQYEDICRYISEISEDDYFELTLLGLEAVAPFFDRAEIGNCEDFEDGEDIGHFHDLYFLSSPEMKEYYRLCRIYEYKHGIEPEDNEFVKSADNHYSWCMSRTEGQFYPFFDDDIHTTALKIEICPDYYSPQPDLIYAVHETLEFYKDNLNKLRRELLQGELTFLLMLPAWRGDDYHVQNDL